MHRPSTPAAAVVGTLLLALLTSSCQDRGAPDAKALASPEATASQVAPPSFVGTPPEAPTTGASSTRSGAKSDVTKSQQSNDMPMPGQANDHSTLAPNASQKANANSGKP
jgi:PBP1b-binding outer membrane lipoprotein LpoB